MHEQKNKNKKQRPGKRYMGIGVDKSLPTCLEKAKNSAVACFFALHLKKTGQKLCCRPVEG
jgi:hypothetical protein